MTSGAPRAARRRLHPAQRRLLLVTALLVLGAFLPWLYTGVGNFSGMRGGGLLTFYASMLALAGALVPQRTLAGVQGGLAGLAGVVLPAYQLWHIFSLVGTAGWMPGPGLVLSLGGGVLGLVAARELLSGEASAERRQGG